MAFLSFIWWQKTSFMNWCVYYGNQFEKNTFEKMDLAILEPDQIDVSEYKNHLKTKFIAYLSLGEIHESRWYWGQLKNKSFVIEENPNWPQAHRVDIRSKDWQDFVLNEIIPAIIKKGYSGLFFDTIDSAIYFEQKDPQKYIGSQRKLIEFIQTIKKQYPQLLLIPNNGLEVLPAIGDQIYGVLVEDLFTKYNFEQKMYTKTANDINHKKIKVLDDFKNNFEKPVFNIVYAKNKNDEIAKYGIKMSTQKKYQYFVTTVDLMQLP